MSSEIAVQRTRVLRGAAAAKIRGAALDADLSLLRPIMPMAQTAADVEEATRAMREEASRVGYEDGYTAGRTRAMADAREQLDAIGATAETVLRSLDAAAADLAARQAGVVADVEQTIAAMAVQIAEAILDRELRACDAPARDAVRRALQMAPERADAVARVHPDDLASLGDLTTLTADRTVSVVADPTIERGGCILDVGPCRIDAQIGPALRRVREVLDA